jgi:GTPase-associated system helical domain
MIEIARHVRIFDKDPSDDLVLKRTAAVTAIAEKFLQLQYVTDLLALANDIATGVGSNGFTISETRSVEIEDLVKIGSTAFVREEQRLQLLVLSMLAVLQIIKDVEPGRGGWTKNEVIAIGLWLALSFQVPRSEPRLEALRAELLASGRDLVVRSAEAARVRRQVPDIAVKTADITEIPKLGDAIKNGASKTIDILRTNAALDREEIDLLWWVLSDWSVLFQKSFGSMSVPMVAIASGMEAGRLMRRLPSEAHKHLVLRRITENPTFSLQGVVTSLNDESATLRGLFADNENVKTCPSVFPLLAGIHGNIISGRELSLRDWGGRALLESSVIHISGLTSLV